MSPHLSMVLLMISLPSLDPLCQGPPFRPGEAGLRKGEVFEEEKLGLFAVLILLVPSPFCMVPKPNVSGGLVEISAT